MGGKEDLKRELEAFSWVSDKRAEALSGHHDDIVMSLCLALWVSKKIIPIAEKVTKYKPMILR